MAAMLPPGQTYEVETATPLLDSLKTVLMVSDQGFDAETLREKLPAQG